MTEREKIAHVLRRFAFGATSADLDEWQKIGLSGTISRLINFETTPDNWGAIDPQAIRGPNTAYNLGSVRTIFNCRLLTTPRPLEEKLTLFWHDHFATSAQKVVYVMTMERHIGTLREHCAGQFLDLLTAVSKDPAMLFWLDNNENNAGKPNENFAREVMELFTLGVDNGYTEQDVLEAARAFTGWTFGTIRSGKTVPIRIPLDDTKFIKHDPTHDKGAKTIFGKTGNWDGDDVLQMLCAKPQTARYITKKMWEWFAYPDPEEEVIERIAQKFQVTGLDIKTLVRGIMEAPQFYSDRAHRSVIKNPVDFCVSTARAMGLDEIQFEQASAAKGRVGIRPFSPGWQISRMTTRMGMELLYPPDVNGWVNGREWITTATMIERIRWADELFGNSGYISSFLRGKHLEILGNPTSPQSVAEQMLKLLDADNMRLKLPQLAEAANKASKGRINGNTIRPAMVATGRLIFGSPEFQFM